MKIEEGQDSKLCRVKDIPPGTCFRWNEHILMMIEHNGTGIFGVSLVSGSLIDIPPGDQAEIITAKVIIEK